MNEGSTPPSCWPFHSSKPSSSTCRYAGDLLQRSGNLECDRWIQCESRRFNQYRNETRMAVSARCDCGTLVESAISGNHSPHDVDGLLLLGRHRSFRSRGRFDDRIAVGRIGWRRYRPTRSGCPWTRAAARCRAQFRRAYGRRILCRCGSCQPPTSTPAASRNTLHRSSDWVESRPSHMRMTFP